MSAFALGAAMLLCAAAAQAAGTGLTEARLDVETTRRVTLDYLLFLPDDYATSPTERFPLVLFLHGAGERGSDLGLVRLHGPPKVVAEWTTFPAILVAPQCPDRDFWRTPHLFALLNTIEAEHPVDPDRIYITGLSMGGYAAWAMALEEPERFAAAIPICGGARPFLADRLTSLPIRAFHGEVDEVVPLSESAKMIAAIRRRGGNAHLTIYHGVGHDSWTRTYANPEVWEWLFAQRR